MKFHEAIIFTLLGIGIVFILYTGIEKQEKVECIKWQRWEKSYDEFYITEWQKSQCINAGIEINAPVQNQ